MEEETEKTLQCCVPPVLSESSHHSVCPPVVCPPVTAAEASRTGSPAAGEGPCSADGLHGILIEGLTV